MIVQVRLDVTPEGWTFSAVDAGGRAVAQWGGRRKGDNEFVLFGVVPDELKEALLDVAPIDVAQGLFRVKAAAQESNAA